MCEYFLCRGRRATRRCRLLAIAQQQGPFSGHIRHVRLRLPQAQRSWSRASRQTVTRAGMGADARSGHLDCNNCRIRRSPPLSCIIRTAVGPVRPVAPGDRRLEVLVLPETHPGCVSGRSGPGRSLLFSAGWRPCRSLGSSDAKRQPRPRRGAHEAARDGFLCFCGPLDEFCGARTRRAVRLGIAYRLLRRSKHVALHIPP